MQKSCIDNLLQIIRDAQDWSTKKVKKRKNVDSDASDDKKHAE